MAACERSRLELVELLLSRGANIHSSTTDGASALFLALQNIDDALVDLLSNQANVNNTRSVSNYIHPSIHPSMHPSIHQSTRSSVCPSVHPSIHPPTPPFIHLSMRRRICFWKMLIQKDWWCVQFHGCRDESHSIVCREMS